MDRIPPIALKTEEIRGEEARIEMQLVASSWKQIAEETTDPRFADICMCAKKVNLIAEQRTHRIENFLKTFSIVISYDVHLMTRAFGYIKQQSLSLQKEDQESRHTFVYLNYLSTDPENFLSETGKIRGLGESILFFLFEKCRSSDEYVGIVTQPLPLAAPFFKKYHFVEFPCVQPKVTMLWFKTDLGFSPETTEIQTSLALGRRSSSTESL